MLLKNNMEDESLIVDPNEVQFEKHDDIEMLVIDSGLDSKGGNVKTTRRF